MFVGKATIVEYFVSLGAACHLEGEVEFSRSPTPKRVSLIFGLIGWLVGWLAVN